MRLLMERELCSFKTINRTIENNYLVTSLSTKEDEKEWERIISKVFDFECNIEKNLKNEPIFNKDRVFIIKDKNKIIATASAWYREEFGEDYGYLHMVAVDPDYRGKGLSSIVVNKAMEYMKNEGRKKVILKTDDYRIEAIGLYKSLGFNIREKI